ncbi:hypothetical protein Y695_02259 [Hydrogenophaga sp. T4]|nr:hypothetical protein Y695_02259 [Hydrogenophaga sp. T4]
MPVCLSKSRCWLLMCTGSTAFAAVEQPVCTSPASRHRLKVVIHRCGRFMCVRSLQYAGEIYIERFHYTAHPPPVLPWSEPAAIARPTREIASSARMPLPMVPMEALCPFDQNRFTPHTHHEKNTPCPATRSVNRPSTSVDWTTTSAPCSTTSNTLTR